MMYRSLPCESVNFVALDAAGQVGPGVFDANVNFLGNYDECQKVKASQDTYYISVGGKNVSHLHTSDGKYCRVYWKVEEEVSTSISNLYVIQ